MMARKKNSYVNYPGAIIARGGQVFTQRHDGDKHWLECKNPDGTIENYITVDGRLEKIKEEQCQLKD